MKSMFLTLSAAVCFNLLLADVVVADNYSLWPKRPPEIEQARRMVRAAEYDRAVEILKPFVSLEGVVGREARKISSGIQVPKYLSRRNPTATIYTVRAGDTLHRIVNTTQCPAEMIMLLNGISDPSALKAGQRIVVTKMSLRVEIYPAMREICVWDEDDFVASYDIESLNLPEITENQKTIVEARDGMLDGDALAKRSAQFLSSERVISLSGGIKICGTQGAANHCVCLKNADVNELALLAFVGAEVIIVKE